MSTRIDLQEIIEREILGRSITKGAREAAQAILQAGWRPPMRDICTPTDMKTLISGALVRDREGLFRVLSEPDAVDFENHGPFRVVWEPEGEA